MKMIGRPTASVCRFNLLNASLLIMALAGCTEPGRSSKASEADDIIAQSVEWNLTALLSHNAANRSQAFNSFKRHWADARSEVIKLMNSDSVSRRLAVAYLLTELGSEEDLVALRACLADSSLRVRLQAIEGLVRRKDKSSAAALADRVRSGSYEEQRIVMAALVVIDAERATSLVAQLILHSEWVMRRVAVQASGSLADTASEGGIVKALHDPVWMVREDAVTAVQRRNLVNARDEVVRLTGSEAWTIRAAALRCLGSFGFSDDFATIERLVRTDPEKKVRIAGVQSLARFPAYDTVPVFMAVLERPSEHLKVRRAAVRMLASLGGSLGRSQLESLLTRGDSQLTVLVEEVVGAPAMPLR